MKVGETVFSVLHTPGHTGGSVVLRAGDTLFTGDTLFKGSMGRTDLPGGSYEEMRASLRRLGALEGDLTSFPVSTDRSTLDHERKYNYYLKEAMEEDSAVPAGTERPPPLLCISPYKDTITGTPLSR